MAFEASRPDPVRLARVPFGEQWQVLVDPADLAQADANDARVRLGMYRHLVERLNPHGAFGAHDERSPFWGYASQLAWQHRTGRLGGTPDRPHAIAAASWWGACNFALSVVPYVAAMDRGLVPRLSVEVRGYHAVMPAWHSTFEAMIARDVDHDRVRVLVWAAHLESITLAVRMNETPFCAMPAGERRFATGWVRMVDLFAAAGVRTDLDKLVETGGGALPPRMIGDADDLADFHRHEKSTVRRVGALADRPRVRWRLEMALWRRIMRSRAARADAEGLLAGMLGKRDARWPAAAKALAYATLPARLVDFAR